MPCGTTKPGWLARAARNLTVNDGLASNVILSLAAAANGDLWVGTPDGLNRIHGNRVDTFTSADGLPDDFIRSLLIDADGSLWIGTRRGLTHWTIEKSGLSGLRPNAGMKTYTQASGLGSDLVGAMARDAKGDLWVATLAGLSRLRGDAISNFTTADGLSSNVVTALLPRADGNAAHRDAGPRMERVGWAASSAQRRKAALSRRRFTRSWTTAKGTCGLQLATALRGATGVQWAERARGRAVRIGSSSAPPTGCAAGRRRPTATRRHGERATGICGLLRRRGWWRWIRRTFP